MINRAVFLLHHLACVALLFSGTLAAANSQDAARLDQGFPRSSLQIATPDARLHTFDVWVADTDARRQRGLMFVSHLNDDQGMLFIYPQPQPISIWMKNTLIPLDLLFVSPAGRVEHVIENTTPHSLEGRGPREAMIAVIELKAGTAARLKIRAGARVIHAAFQEGSG
jgi:uncharacterized membrane protein (UPF0127 family)